MHLNKVRVVAGGGGESGPGAVGMWVAGAEVCSVAGRRQAANNGLPIVGRHHRGRAGASDLDNRVGGGYMYSTVCICIFGKRASAILLHFPLLS